MNFKHWRVNKCPLVVTEATNMERVSLQDHVQKLLSNGNNDDGSSALPPPPVGCIISRPSDRMLEANPQAYEPRLVSIGPYYLHKETLLPMLQHKLRIYLQLLHELYGSTTDIYDNDIKMTVDRLVDTAKKCYQDDYVIHDSNSADFPLMMTLDGCFIIHLFRSYNRLNTKKENNEDDPIFRTRWMLPALRVDLVKLGNQLPFFVLQELYNLIIRTSSALEEPSLTELAAHFFAPLHGPDHHRHMPEVVNARGSGGHAHLLALLHSTFRPTCYDDASLSISGNADELQPNHHTGCMGSIKDLQDHGIKIRPGRGHILDIKFHQKEDLPKLEIPPLSINQNIVPVFLNLVAHEQNNRSIPSHWTSYLVFLLGLVNSAEDVQVLRSLGIINPELSTDEQVAMLFNCLAKEVTHNGDKSYLSTTIKLINMRKNNRFQHWRATLRRKYFPEPWSASPYLLSVVALYLTGMQIALALLSYKG